MGSDEFLLLVPAEVEQPYTRSTVAGLCEIAVLSGIIAARIFPGGAQLTILRCRWPSGPPRCTSSQRRASRLKFKLLGRAMACLAILGKSRPRLDEVLEELGGDQFLLKLL